MSDSNAPKTEESNEDEILHTFDMYHFFSRKDVIFAIIFLIAFLIFAIAVNFVPQFA